jgi:hypothetical protein
MHIIRSLLLVAFGVKQGSAGQQQLLGRLLTVTLLTPSITAMLGRAGDGVFVTVGLVWSSCNTLLMNGIGQLVFAFVLEHTVQDVCWHRHKVLDARH